MGESQSDDKQVKTCCCFPRKSSSSAQTSQPSIASNILLTSSRSNPGNNERAVMQSIIENCMSNSNGWSGKLSTSYKIVSNKQPYVFKKWKDEAMCKYLGDNLNVINDLKRLRHGNIRVVYDYYPDPGGLLLEFLNLSLDELLKDNKLPECGTRLSILSDIANGLRYIHDYELVHNNLKCTNVLINENGTAKLADGCIQVNCSKNIQLAQSSKVDKIGYFCEEALRGMIDYSNDIYSFGAICLVVVSGKAIYDSNRKPTQLKDYLLNTSYKNWKYLKDKGIKWKKNINYLNIYRPRKVLLTLSAACLAENAKERPQIELVFTECKQVLDKWKQKSSQD
ncbi:G-type lectin S-receptor-like serine/threonine-protein kinase SRK [Trichoplax sp. H2]|nr:G-type lectin S-receptor-like serine/threonine-protein kinase SRK [Trichoplax sp. H2]|eukprot:RDD38104.1 G-type lectin S-receptor-like serine/threonine-protein kinase SRK [Trichoplax sp. H2]